MGHGIAQVFALAGHDVTVLDANPAAFDAARSKVARNLELMLEYGLVTSEQTAAVSSRLNFTTNLADVGQSALIIEAVTESLDVKRAVYADLAPHLAADTLLASNTSSIPIHLMADATGRPDRFTTTHFFRPAYLCPMVEVTKGELTSEATVESVLALLRGAGLRPVRINVDLPGQVANRLRQALFREALDLVDRGVISAEDIDELTAFSLLAAHAADGRHPRPRPWLAWRLPSAVRRASGPTSATRTAGTTCCEALLRPAISASRPAEDSSTGPTWTSRRSGRPWNASNWRSTPPCAKSAPGRSSPLLLGPHGPRLPDIAPGARAPRGILSR